MHYIVGLGNPGEKYINTRHNVGFAAVEFVIEKSGLPDLFASSKYGGRMSEGIFTNTDVRLLLPDTYMNNSGSAVRKLIPKDEEDSLVVIYDDVDLPIGEIKVSVGRGSGGHNGVTSIVNSLGTKDFVRIRIGVASRGFFGLTRRPKGEKLSKHVLGAFSKRESSQLPEVYEKVHQALVMILDEGVEKAMNAYN